MLGPKFILIFSLVTSKSPDVKRGLQSPKLPPGSAPAVPLLHINHLDDRSENWCLVGLLNIDAYSGGVKESNSKPVTYSTNKYNKKLGIFN